MNRGFDRASFGATRGSKSRQRRLARTLRRRVTRVAAIAEAVGASMKPRERMWLHVRKIAESSSLNFAKFRM